MFNNPYWAPTAMINPFPYPMIPQPLPQQQQAQPQPTQTTSPQPSPSIWNWKAVSSYQSMLMESVPFDGSPVLFMIQNEPIFYVVRMEEGKKMINGFTFTPLDNPEPLPPDDPPEVQIENRLTGLENNMNSIMIQLQKLVEVRHHESNNESIDTQPAKRKAVTITPTGESNG